MGPADDPLSLTLPQPYLLFLGDTVEPATPRPRSGCATGRRALRRRVRAAERDRQHRPAEAHAANRRATKARRRWSSASPTPAGLSRTSWVPALVEALEAGLHIISGMHARLNDVPEIRAAAERAGRRLIDVREPPANIPDRDRAETQRQAAAHRRHRLRIGQEIYRAGNHAFARPARHRRRFPRHRPDRDHDRRTRHSDGRGGRRFRRRRRGTAQPVGRPTITGT